MASERIDEQSRRKPGFKGEVGVVLADDQTWYFPRPYELFSPGLDDEAPAQPAWSVGPEYAALVRRFEEAVKAPPGERSLADLMARRFAMIRFLLRLNYDLTPEEEVGLLRLGVNESVPDDVRTRTRALFDLTDGVVQAPKPGDDTSSSA